MFTSRTLLFLTFLVALFVASYAQDTCLLFTTCDDCTAETTGTCGWCESTDECLAGNAVGPGGNALNCSEWFFDNCLAVDCFQFTSCSSCLRDPFCGWCEATSLCVEGLRTGPVTGTCSDYIFDRSNCPTTSTTATTSGRRTTTTGRRTTTTGRLLTTGTASTGTGTTGTVTGTTGTGTTGTGTTGTGTGTTGTGTTGTGTGTTGTGTTGTGTGTTGTGTTGTGTASTGGRRTSTGAAGTTGTATTAGGTTGTNPTSSSSSSSSSGTTGGAVSSGAYSINSASVFVAIGVVIIALINLL